MKKIISLAALLILVTLQVAVLMSRDLTERAAGRSFDLDKRAGLFRSSLKLYPIDDQAWLGLARTGSEKAVEALGDARTRDAALKEARASFAKALALNPASAEGHFYLGQVLLFTNYLEAKAAVPYFEEYRKAATLTGHNTELYFESGKVLLSKWGELGAQEKAFTQDILKKALSGGDPSRLRQVLEIWLLQVGDTKVIESVMPQDPGVLRAYAAFLGEKSFSLEPRRRALARAERLDFEKAGDELESGRRQMDYYRSDKAVELLGSSLRRLDRIRFYGALAAGGETIDRQAWTSARDQALALLARAQVERSGSLDDPKGVIKAYLENEDDPEAINEFEKFLRERGALPEKGTDISATRDLKVLAFELDLDFRQHRFRDITQVGEALAASTLVIPREKTADYVRILDIIGNSLLKLDYLYEAEKQFSRALELDPSDLDTLFGLEKCYLRLNDDKKLQETRKTMAGLLTLGDLPLGGQTADKGVPCPVNLVCGEGKLDFELTIENSDPTDGRPLITIVFNGKVVREDYADGGTVAFKADAGTGRNLLEITSVNRRVRLLRLKWSPEGESGANTR